MVHRVPARRRHRRSLVTSSTWRVLYDLLRAGMLIETPDSRGTVEGRLGPRSRLHHYGHGQ